MSTEFNREERYIVFKMSGLGNSLKGDEIRKLAREYAEHLEQLGKKPLDYVVVEADWSEYGPTWKAIEARVTGPLCVPEESAIQTAARIMNIELIRERDALRAKIERMEQQEPVAWIRGRDDHRRRKLSFEKPAKSSPDKFHWSPLYALPGAQPASSAPNGWLRAIDEALVVAHLGVANPNDTYEQARVKLDSLIGFHADVATDPAVNGGWKLVPIEPTTNMLCEMERQWMLGSQIDMAKREWKAALAAAPESSHAD